MLSKRLNYTAVVTDLLVVLLKLLKLLYHGVAFAQVYSLSSKVCQRWEKLSVPLFGDEVTGEVIFFVEVKDDVANYFW
ncbi:hypothetical protein F5H01DRAFT_357529 [Linnemannia elongata]|nr:hypothetical protein F5H01DRAFT_357529 [Linnemannia elongata]